MATERIQRRIDSLLDEADEAVSKLDWATVRDRARAVLGLDSGNGDALAYMEAAERELEGLVAPGSAEQGTSTPPTQAAPATDQPTSFADGRYQVRKFLGEGGKKRVYLAHDSVLDGDVALAVIKTEGLVAMRFQWLAHFKLDYSPSHQNCNSAGEAGW